MKAVDLVGAVGEKEYYHPLVILTYDTGSLETVEFGHVDVEKNQVGMQLVIQFEPHAAVVSVCYPIAFGLDKAL